MRAKRTTRVVLVAALASLLFLGGVGSASAVVPGGLATIAGAGGCTSNAGAGGCTVGHDMGSPTAIAVSPDGKNVYVAGTDAAVGFSLLTFDRNTATGQLTQKGGLDGCFRSAGGATANCRLLTAGTALNNPTDIAITPDGASVYVSNSANDSILVFNRNTGGVLTQKAGALCISNSGAAPCADADSMDGPQSLAMDKDGRFLYVASSLSSGVTGLRIGAGGALSQLTGAGGLSGCVNQSGGAPCDDGRALASATSVAVSRSGNAVYALSAGGKSLAVITRNPDSGLLAMSTAATGCWENAAADNCNTISPDFTGGLSLGELAVGGGGEVYVQVVGDTNTGFTSRVVTFDPSGDGLARRTAGTSGCVSNGAAAGCSTGRGLAVPTAILPTADNEDVYATGGAGGGVVELDRNAANGTLTPRGDTRGCLMPSSLSGCTPFAALGTPTELAASPDNRHVYVANTTARITVLKRDSSGPVCADLTADVPAGSVTALPLPCSDPDFDPLGFEVTVPPTLGDRGGIDTAAGTIIYAAPQNQNGTTKMTLKASYIPPAVGNLTNTGSITINVSGASTGGTVVPVGVDNDKDGFTAGQDCNDNDPKIRPGALEIKGNRIDENCDTIAEPFPTLTVGITHNWAFKKGSARLTLRALTITQATMNGVKVKIFCKGKRCAFKSKSLKLGKPAKKTGARSVMASLTKKQRSFRAGQTVEVWISAPGFNTKVARLPLKKGKAPLSQSLCVVPGQSKPQKKCD